MTQGLIALDIDGTVTPGHAHVPEKTEQFLHNLVNEGWGLVFITGRPFSHVKRLFSGWQFPYYVAPQNGALLIEMPSEEVVMRRCIGRESLPVLDQIFEGSGVAIYGGWDVQDQVFYVPSSWNDEMQRYLLERCATFKEQWIALESWDALPIDAFASVKGIGKLEEMNRVAKEMQDRLKLHCPVIRDPYQEGMYVAQATHPEVNKGRALLDVKALLKIEGPSISAGDDHNDHELLEQADIAIAMQGAPESIKQKASIIAESVENEGLIAALEEAISRCPQL